ncbi:pyridoxamine 5'-phosphate oxidase family protein [Dactylosporangium sp. NPDC000555]|uniref:pyridoxamine 5'-phosphate oxidase family protein n=1 Tax=Dactylosporangium sp. NPDC000555 TaxID=3154260 RepID=UPI003325E3E0
MATTVPTFSMIEGQFNAYLREIVYATMTTVDAKGRPRARVLIAVWEQLDQGPQGWLATYKTPVKAAHLANNPHATFSYWSPRQNAVAIDTVTEWVHDIETKQYVWQLYERSSPTGVGYDLGNFWHGGPADPKLHVLRLNPWRIQVIRGRDLQSRIWRAPDAD